MTKSGLMPGNLGFWLQENFNLVEACPWGNL